jgi:Na+/melibiose symporter-like transporter
MYTVLETTLYQILDITASSVPVFVLALNGYRNNGGCSCGCGVACPNYFERWRCPGDIGYACSGLPSLALPPFYGEAGRESPCTEQPERVRIIIHMLATLVPAIMLAISAAGLLFTPIDSSIHQQIIKQTR